MLRVRSSVLLFLSLLLVTSLVATVVRAQTPPPPPPPPFSGTPVITTPTPAKGVKLPSAFHATLSKKQKSQALAIVKKDKNVTKLLKGRKYKMTTITVWRNPAAQMIGSVVSYRFTSPQKLSGTFADLSFPCKTTATKYKADTYKAKYAGVTVLTVSVDLKKKKVAAVSPLGYIVGQAHYSTPHVSSPGATPVPPCQTT
jgi:hypothetical protein